MTYSNADFTPGMKGYSDIKPFRFWCQKVLPLVYDDSLSYYELLCRVTDYINNIITDLAATEDNVDALLNAYNQLQDYVNNYFTNLDVQEEINNHLDDLVADGTLTELIGNYIQPRIDEINDELDNYEATMNQNFSGLQSATESSVQQQNDKIFVLEGRMDTFSSLTQGSTTGDAELQDIRVTYDGTVFPTAGDAVRDQSKNNNSILKNLMSLNNVPVFNKFHQGDIDANGVESERTDNKTFCTDFIEQKNLVSITVNSGYAVTVFYYTSAQEFISYVVRNAGTFTINKGNGYIKLRTIKGSYSVYTVVEAQTQSHTLYRNNAISKSISNNRLKSDNVIIGAIHDGNYIDVNGQILPATGDWGYTDFSPIESETEYYLYSFARKNKIISNSYITFYNSDKEWISGIQKYNNTPITTPPNSCYVRISCPWLELRYIYLTASSTAPMYYKRYDQDSLVNTLSKYNRSFYQNVRSIAKDGINTLAEFSGFPVYPHCSKYSYISAIYEGFDGILMHILKTSDSKFVVCHENNISGLAKNDNGTSLSTPYNISEHTLSEIKTVDMGYDYGEMYRGTRIMTLEEGLTLVKKLNTYLVIEPSGLTQSDYITLASTIKQYGFTHNVGVHSYYANNLREVKNIIPNAMLLLDGTGSSDYINAIISDAINLKTEFNSVCVGKLARLDNNMTETLVQRMIDNEISYFISNPSSEPDGFLEYMEQSPLASYVTFVNSQCIPASKMLIDTLY